jgi:hypothetical protein
LQGLGYKNFKKKKGVIIRELLGETVNEQTFFEAVV